MSPINSFSSKVAITMVALAAVVAPTANSFTPRSSASVSRVNSAGSVANNNNMSPLYAEETKDDSSAVFMPPPSAEDSDGEGTKETDIDLKTVEMLGRGAAKTKRGKRKGGPAPKSGAVGKASATLAPEEIHYEGPPAITETIIPTVSILTVVGIIPAIASWSRQAWVRYKITTRRIRVTSGIGGKDMAEIVYNDIIELRTVKRLFGDGDMVAFLKDGAKFEMRNIPDFEETMNFILEQVDPDVKKEYLTKGDVTRPQKPE
jgi:hypothetical protein